MRTIPGTPQASGTKKNIAKDIGCLPRRPKPIPPVWVEGEDRSSKIENIKYGNNDATFVQYGCEHAPRIPSYFGGHNSRMSCTHIRQPPCTITRPPQFGTHTTSNALLPSLRSSKPLAIKSGPKTKTASGKVPQLKAKTIGILPCPDT